MLEVLQNFQSDSGVLSPIALVVPGLIAVVVGLFVWLGGLGFRKLLFALLGVIIGATLGFFVIGQNIVAVVISAAVVAVITLFFQRLLIAVLTAVLVAAIAFAILARANVGEATETRQEHSAGILRSGETLSIGASIEATKAYAVDFGEAIRQVFSRMRVYQWLIMAALAAVCFVAGIFLWRLSTAFCCATMGTMLIFTGMVLLLLYKGSEPITKIDSKAPFYAGVFVVMTAFGTVEQLLLYRSKSRHLKRKAKATPEEQEPEKTKQSWRTT